jgi:flagellar hook-associated protein 3 FlgL
MLLPVNGSTQQYLDDLSRVQSGLDNVQRRLSSGFRVGKPSDDPAAIQGILKGLSQIAQDTGAQTNLDQVKTELASGDAALQQAATLLDQAVSLAMQAASTPGSAKFAELARETQSIQQQLVGLSRTMAGGRYIFGGDLDQSAPYAYDASQPDGVQRLTNPTSTRVIVDRGGATIWIPKTAQEIFDARNAGGSAAAGNAFAALGGLLTALEHNDVTAAAASVDSLKAAGDHLNQQLGLYGIAESRASDASDSVSRALVAEKKDLGDARDADVAGDAIQLSQLTLQQQAALAAGAKRRQNSLFDYLA